MGGDLFRADDPHFGFGGAAVSFAGGTLARTAAFGRAQALPTLEPLSPLPRLHTLPDLGATIGSRAWWQGAAGCLALCVSAITLCPGVRPLDVRQAPLSPTAAADNRDQGIAPLARGGDTGKRMMATDAVQPLTEIPERPQIELTATLGQGDGIGHALERAGVSATDAARVLGLLAPAVDPATIAPGTALNLTLGRRAQRTDPRPLQALAFRARLDLRVAFVRVGNALSLQQTPIAVDRMPLRIEGRVGESLYAAARAAGAPGEAVQSYIRALAPKVDMGDIGPDARFSLTMEQARAATGEVEYGKLLYIGLSRGDRATQMIRWTIDGHEDWYDAAGVGAPRGGFTMPVAGAHKTSGFGMRLHPLLGYSRMHQGTDYGAAWGSPIRAVTDGVVAFAGWHGGHGNMVKLAHAGGLGSGYAHMSRIAVTPGARVSQGQVIGFVGSTGLSTGPHLHFEVYRGAVAVDPGSVSFQQTPLLSGTELAAFKARLNSYAQPAGASSH